MGSLEDWQVQPKADRRRYLKALHVYLSALLLLYGTCKEELLAKLGMTEGEFMKAWQGIFLYDAAAQAIFDKVLTPAFRERGIDGLVTAAGESIREVLFQPDSPFGKQQQCRPAGSHGRRPGGPEAESGKARRWARCGTARIAAGCSK